jgi:hypothetical protein
MGDFITAPAIGTRLAVDRIAGVDFPISKLAFGAEDAATQVSAADPFPVSDPAVLAAIQALLPGSGELPTGAATDATLQAIGALLAGVLSVSVQSSALPTGAATQATLASLLAKTIAAPATEAKQDASVTVLGQIVTALAATLKVQTPIPVGVVAGQAAVTTSATALPAAALVNGIVVKAAASNTATVWIGGSNVTTSVNGYPLAPGEAMSFAVANASALYLISTAAAIIYFGGN